MARSLTVVAALAVSTLLAAGLQAQQGPSRPDPRQQGKPGGDTVSAAVADARQMLQTLVERRRRDSLQTIVDARRRDSIRRADSARSARRSAADSLRYARSIDSLRRVLQIAEAAMTASQADSLPMLRIEDVVPRTARPGDTVALLLSRAPSSSMPTHVRFGPESTSVLFVRGSAAYVRVPTGLPRDSTQIVFAEGASRTSEFAFMRTQGPGSGPRSWPWATIVAIALVPLASAGIHLVRRREASRHRREVERLRNRLDLGRVEPSPADSAGQGASPDIPPDLVTACATDACVLFAGPGLAAQGGLPTGRAILEELVEAAAQNDAELASLHAALNDERYSEVAEIVHNRMGPAEKIAVAKAAFEQPATGELGGTHRDLRDIGFVSAITSSWDPLISQVGRRVRAGSGGPRDAAVLYAKRTESIPKTFDDAAFYLVRLHGDLDHPDTFSFTAEEAYAALQENRTLHRYVTSLILSRTVLFLGTGLGGLEDFFRGAGIMNIGHSPTTTAGRVHYALVPFSRDWSIQVERFRAKYGIQLLGYTPSEGHPQVGKFIERVAQLVREARARAPERVLAADILSEVRLRNIGAFRDVTVSFNSGWNVILGSNGSGKSTILKAIALGLCGDDQTAAAAGASLLRRGGAARSGDGLASGSPDGSADVVTDGSIEIQVGSTRYTTALRRENGRTRVRSGLTPLQAGSWVVMGFPPLRGVSSQNPTGPRTATSATPDVDDLVPLISGAVDQRLDNLKQWIVNLDYGARPDSTTKPDEVDRNRRLRQAFFDVLKILMAENKLEFKEVTPVSFQVIVDTDDGPVPIDLLSQGMTSIIGWVGAMLQRMYEIHRHAARPEHEPALVLVDEIDSHLHPAWQQQLVPRLRECFPKLQIIATTHSPLLVAGMKASEVLIARRDPIAPDRVSVAPAPLEFEGLRADQILTSPAFGLMTTRGVETRNEQDEFVRLLGNQHRSLEEEGRFQELESRLRAKFQVGETDEQRRVERAVTSTLVAMADPHEVANVAPGSVLPPAIKLALQQRLRELFPRKEEEKRP